MFATKLTLTHTSHLTQKLTNLKKKKNKKRNMLYRPKFKTYSYKTSWGKKKDKLCSFGQKFLRTQNIWSIKKKLVNWISSKFKTFALWKISFRKWKGRPKTSRKYWQHIYQNKDSISNVKRTLKVRRQQEETFFKRRYTNDQ